MRRPKKFRPYPFEYHQEIELDITALSNLGVGIARVKLSAENTAASLNHDAVPSTGDT
ncbi:MAG: hypothetical protein HKP20_09050, partial [Akkermansiaceae bacterium]|nr:hypothetical protein [Akkermansiaceae bacterium]